MTKAVSALRSGLMRITANPGRSGSKLIESRPYWCTNAQTHGAAPRAKHVTIQKWRRRRVCFVHLQLPKFPIDILSFPRSSQPWYSIRIDIIPYGTWYTYVLCPHLRLHEMRTRNKYGRVRTGFDSGSGPSADTARLRLRVSATIIM